MPYKRPQTKKSFFKKHQYVYDEYFDCYLCPVGKILESKTTNREGYKVYESNPDICKTCKFLHKCAKSKDHKKRISRHIWEGYLKEAEHLRHTRYNKELYELRSQTIERVFADLKEKHGMRYTTLRGLDKITMQAMLAFACLNLKKLANWKWRARKEDRTSFIFCLVLRVKLCLLKKTSLVYVPERFYRLPEMHVSTFASPAAYACKVPG